MPSPARFGGTPSATPGHVVVTTRPASAMPCI
ncbi:hypothetical protein BAE44_0006296 [Dichanthelium oligosanthes]|uniref:Uncharacterized protein n=1 Tax=Dichanthelium oligosanthes TaxID=888268 RepID=A0A1E5W5P4_9POAL|nr:hypothetical protein BAE44_0006296 [Dichanthelium oligosanthes]